MFGHETRIISRDGRPADIYSANKCLMRLSPSASLPAACPSAFKCPILMAGKWKIRYRPDAEGVKFSHCRDPNGSANGRESNFVNAVGIHRHSSRITHRRIDNAIICALPSRVPRAAARREFISLSWRYIGDPCRIATHVYRKYVAIINCRP